ncbi:MAG: hypothetical protein N2234_09910 [Planctomycetota bacterium]|nr:hypothetical protein [Planctomycetota bacterium]
MWRLKTVICIIFGAMWFGAAMRGEGGDLVALSAETVTLRGGERANISIRVEKRVPEIAFHPKETPPKVEIRSAPPGIKILSDSLLAEEKEGNLMIKVPVVAETVKDDTSVRIELVVSVFYCHDVEGRCRLDELPCSVDVRLLTGSVLVGGSILILKILAGILVVVLFLCAVLKIRMFYLFVISLFIGAVFILNGVVSGQHIEAREIATQL